MLFSKIGISGYYILQYKTLREEAWKANVEIPQRGLVIYTWENFISMLDAVKEFNRAGS